MSTLYVVGTPIGNLGDLTPRAIEVLSTVAVIYCEDTRHSRPLLTHAGVTGQRLLSLHEHNEAERVTEVLNQLNDGADIALISDAGMPVVSDPGQRLVAAVAEAGHTVSAVPGPTAAMTALAVSGLPAERWCFEGFLPASGSTRRERLEALASGTRTAILYESPHKLIKTIGDLAATCAPERRIVLARELTKLHEEVWRGTLAEAVEHLAANPPRGEYTLILEGLYPVVHEISDQDIRTALDSKLAAGLSRRDAVDAVSTELRVSRKRVYALSLR